MENKELVELVEGLKDEIYNICERQVTLITANFKYRLKQLINEKTRRNELSIGNISWGCSSCIVGILQLYIRPWMESSRYENIKDAVTVILVPLQMIPDDAVTVTPEEKKNVKRVYKKK